MSIWTFAINIANARAGLQKLGTHYDDLYDKMVGKMGTNIEKWNIWEKMLDYAVDATKKLISESRELIAISTKYDIPIKRMGEFQLMAQVAGQSLGQIARNFRFLEMNFSRALLKPGGPQSQALHELGLNQEQITKAAGDTAYAMDIMKSKVMSIGEEERRNYFLQTMYGANWQNMLPILEMSVEAQNEMADGAHRYNESTTAALALVEKNMAEVAQDIKGPLTPIAVLVSFLSTGIMIIIQGFSTFVGVLKDGVVGTLKTAVGLIQVVLGGLSKFSGKALKFLGMEQLGNLHEGSGDEWLKAGVGNVKTGMPEFYDKTAARSKDTEQLESGLRRLTTQGHALSESLGLTEEGSHLKRLTGEVDKLKTKIAGAESASKDLRKRLFEISQLSPEEQVARAGEKASIQSQLDTLDTDLNGIHYGPIQTSGLKGDLTEAKKRLGTYGGIVKTEGGGGKTAAEGGPRTAEEVKRQQDLLASIQKYQFEHSQVARAMQAEIETEVALAKAKEHQLQIAREIAKLQADKAYSPEKELEYQKKAMDANISLMEKEKAHKIFLHQKAVQVAEAERDRKEGLIANMEKREQTYMSRQGMTGMDKQSVMVSNAVEKMVRDQEQLARVMADPMKTQAQKDSARKEVDASALKAQDELDKLSLMQFQYGASDAAKKGMGGGIDIRENQLTVAKSQLDILKQQLDLMRSQYGVDPANYGGTPMIMQGPYRAGK